MGNSLQPRVVIALAEEWRIVEVGSRGCLGGPRLAEGVGNGCDVLGHGDQVPTVDHNCIQGGYCDGPEAVTKLERHEWEVASEESSIQEIVEPEINSSRRNNLDQLESKGQSHENSYHTVYVAATWPAGLSDTSVRSETTNKEFEAMELTVKTHQHRNTRLVTEVTTVRQQLAEANPGMREELPTADEQHNQQPLATTVKKDQDCKSCKTKLAHINMIKKKKDDLINQVEDLKVKIKELEEINATLCRQRAESEADSISSTQENLLSYSEAWVKLKRVADIENATLNDIPLQVKLETPPSDRISFVKVGFEGINPQNSNLLLVHNMQTEKLSVYKEILSEQPEARKEVVTRDWVKGILGRVGGRSEANIAFPPDMDSSSIHLDPLHQSDANCTLQDLQKKVEVDRTTDQNSILRNDKDYLSQIIVHLIREEITWACRNDDYMKLSYDYLEDFRCSSTKVLVASDSITSDKELPSCCLLFNGQYVLAITEKTPNSDTLISIVTPSMLGMGSTKFRRLVDRVITTEYTIVAEGDRASNPEIIVCCHADQSRSRRIASPEFLCHTSRDRDQTSATRQRYGGVLGLYDHTLYYCTSKGVHSVDLTNPKSEPTFVQELELCNGADYFEFIRVVDNYLYGVSKKGQAALYDLKAGSLITLYSLLADDYYPTAICMSKDFLLVAATCKYDSSYERRQSASAQYDNYIFVASLDDLAFICKHKINLVNSSHRKKYSCDREPIRFIKASSSGYDKDEDSKYARVVLFTDFDNAGYLQSIYLNPKKDQDTFYTVKRPTNWCKKNYKS